MKRHTFLIAGAVVVVAALIGLVEVANWPVWVGMLLTLVVVGGLGLAMWSSRPVAPLPPEPLPAPTLAPRPVPPPPPVQIQNVSLPSADSDYRFLLYATVCWRSRPGGSGPLPPSPDELARRIVVDRAAQVTQHEDPGGYDLVQHRLAQILATVTPDRTGSIEVWAHSVVLTLPQEDLDRQYRLSSMRKNEAVWEHERNYERNLRGYLQSEVLGDAGSAVVWWLAQDPKQVRQTTELIGTLAQLAAAANNREVEPALRYLVDGYADHTIRAPVGDLADSPTPSAPKYTPMDMASAGVRALADTLFGPGPTPGDEGSPERAHFADQIARLVSHYGQQELVRRIRADFDAPDLDEAPGADTADEPPGRHGMAGSAADAGDVFVADSTGSVWNTTNGR